MISVVKDELSGNGGGYRLVCEDHPAIAIFYPKCFNVNKDWHLLIPNERDIFDFLASKGASVNVMAHYGWRKELRVYLFKENLDQLSGEDRAEFILRYQ